MSETTYRWTVEERYGHGPWVKCHSDEWPEEDAEKLILLLSGLCKARREGQGAIEQLYRVSTELLGLDFDVYRDLPLSDRIALVVALSDGEAPIGNH